MLSLHNVFKTYQNGPQTLHALNDVSLHFKPGDYTFILGSSGSGKSTMLNLLSGLDRPTKGTIEVDGIDTKNFSKKDWAHVETDDDADDFKVDPDDYKENNKKKDDDFDW